MNRAKKYICLILLVVLIFSETCYIFAMELADPTKIYQEVPDGIALVNEDNYRLNLTLLRDKKIIVYGDAGNVPNNRYKNGSIPLGDINNNNMTTKPYDKKTEIGCYYYRSDLGYGEYEYHGFDLQGNPYSNENFPIDSEMTKPAESYKWIYRIWDSRSTYHKASVIKEDSMYNNIAIGLQEGIPQFYINKMRNNIQSALGWQITNSAGIFNIDEQNPTAAYNYAHVYSLPSNYSNGQVIMHHTNEGKIWYANFSTPRVKQDKEPIKPTAKFENKVEGETCTIDLRGTIDDVAYYKDDVKRSLYFTRQDIVSWDFKFKDQTGKVTEINGIHNTRTNTDTYNFSFPFKTTETQKILKGQVTVNYKNGNEIVNN